MSGYSGTPLTKKLGIRTGTRLFVHAAPEHCSRLIAPLPQNVRTVRAMVRARHAGRSRLDERAAGG
jgi:hypothetical protein